MTEDKWLAARRASEIVKFVSEKLSERKRRLFVVACCRLVWHWISEDSCRNAVLVGENFADKNTTKKALRAARVPTREAVRKIRDTYANHCARHTCLYAVEDDVSLASFGAAVSVEGAACGQEQAVDGVTPTAKAACDVLRDLSGNPFRPVTLDAEWLTSTVVALARDIYEKRAFDQMPILADALQDAGCDNADVLDHCRGKSPHVRGCWVVDQVLGKS